MSNPVINSKNAFFYLNRFVWPRHLTLISFCHGGYDFAGKTERRPWNKFTNGFYFLEARLEFSYPSRFPDRCCNRHHGSDGYDDGKFPVHLKGPKDYCIRLEQIKGIQSLENKKKVIRKRGKNAEWDYFAILNKHFIFWIEENNCA